MIVTSIDISNGKVVQLRNGVEPVLERSDPSKLMEDFSKYGDIAVIDIDSAKGTGSNKDLIVSLLKQGTCRVGGGIRTVEDAKYFIDMGAEKIILGSAVFERVNADNETTYRINLDLLNEFIAKVGKEKIIIALDVREEAVVISGWLVDTGLSIFNVIGELEQYASGFLVTKVEREGLLQGTDIEFFAKLRNMTKAPLTAAGGITETAEIEALSKLGLDVQLGMGVYTGRLGLPEAFCATLDWKIDLLPVIAQDAGGAVLMLGYANREALLETCKRNRLVFFSRSRRMLWMKGETSGNVLDLVKLRVDCDRDTVLVTVIPAGPVCHTGMATCFGEKKFTLENLQAVIDERFRNPKAGSYTVTLDDKLVREKLMEEALEICEASTKEEVIWEAADVLYFLLVLMTKEGVNLDDVLTELRRRKRSSR